MKDLIKTLNMLVKILGGGEERRMKSYLTREIIDYP